VWCACVRACSVCVVFGISRRQLPRCSQTLHSDTPSIHWGGKLLPTCDKLGDCVHRVEKDGLLPGTHGQEVDVHPFAVLNIVDLDPLHFRAELWVAHVCLHKGLDLTRQPLVHLCTGVAESDTV
jgi:hypothetical protein